MKLRKLVTKDWVHVFPGPMRRVCVNDWLCSGCVDVFRYGKIKYGEHGLCFLGVDLILGNGCRI